MDVIELWTDGPVWVRMAPWAGGAVGLLLVVVVVVKGAWADWSRRARLGWGRKGAARVTLYDMACEAFGMKAPTGDPVALRRHGRKTIRVLDWIGAGAPAHVRAYHPITMPTDDRSKQRQTWERLLHDNFPRPDGMQWEHRWPNGTHFVDSILRPERPADEQRALDVVADALDSSRVQIDRTADGASIAVVTAAVPASFKIVRPDVRLETQAVIDARLPSPLGAWRHDWAPKRDLYSATAVAPLPSRVPYPTAPPLVAELVAHGRAGRIVWGLTHNGQPVAWQPGREGQVHGLLAGATGAGKTSAARAIVTSCWLAGYDIIIIDPKGDGDWVWAEDLPGVRVVYDLPGMVHALTGAVDLGELRRREMRAARKQRIEQPNHRPTLVYVDELAELFVRNPAGGAAAKAENELRADAAFQFGRGAALGRSALVRYLGATQRPSREVLHGTTKANLPWRVALGRMDGIAARITLSNALPDKGIDFDLDDVSDDGGRPGHGWCGPVGAQLTEVQALWLPLDTADKLADIREAAYQHARRESDAGRRQQRQGRWSDTQDIPRDDDTIDVEVVDVQRTRRGGPLAITAGARRRRHRSGWET